MSIDPSGFWQAKKARARHQMEKEILRLDELMEREQMLVDQLFAPQQGCAVAVSTAADPDLQLDQEQVTRKVSGQDEKCLHWSQAGVDGSVRRASLGGQQCCPPELLSMRSSRTRVLMRATESPDERCAAVATWLSMSTLCTDRSHIGHLARREYALGDTKLAMSTRDGGQPPRQSTDAPPPWV